MHPFTPLPSHTDVHFVKMRLQLVFPTASYKDTYQMVPLFYLNFICFTSVLLHGKMNGLIQLCSLDKQTSSLKDSLLCSSLASGLLHHHAPFQSATSQACRQRPGLQWEGPSSTAHKTGTERHAAIYKTTDFILLHIRLQYMR